MTLSRATASLGMPLFVLLLLAFPFLVESTYYLHLVVVIAILVGSAHEPG